MSSLVFWHYFVCIILWFKFQIYAIKTYQEPIHHIPVHAQESRLHIQSKHLSMPVNTMGMVSSSSPSKYMYNLNI